MKIYYERKKERGCAESEKVKSKVIGNGLGDYQEKGKRDEAQGQRWGDQRKKRERMGGE
jgi:hypothetical protein